MLENQVDELLQYSNSKLSQYDTQLSRFQNLVDNWSSFDLKMRLIKTIILRIYGFQSRMPIILILVFTKP